MEHIRERLINYLTNNGVMQKFVCEQTGVKKSSLSAFILGTRGIASNNSLKLDEFLTSKNY